MVTFDSSHTKILPYQSDWAEKFEVEKTKLEEAFGVSALEIEHIGSTSVEGLAAKPIIDIAVMIKNFADVDKFIEPLEKIGYKYNVPATPGERHYFQKGDPIEYQLSIAYADRGGFWPRQILFRDYLRQHSEARDEYAKLKIGLLEQDPTGGGTYISGKSEFVYKILELAGWREGQRYR